MHLVRGDDKGRGEGGAGSALSRKHFMEKEP